MLESLGRLGRQPRRIALILSVNVRLLLGSSSLVSLSLRFWCQNASFLIRIVEPLFSLPRFWQRRRNSRSLLNGMILHIRQESSRLLANTAMDAPEMLRQILLSRKANACAAFAVSVRAHTASFWAAMLAVNFTLMAEEAAGVGEALDFFAAWLCTDVGTVMLVHVFAVEYC